MECRDRRCDEVNVCVGTLGWWLLGWAFVARMEVCFAEQTVWTGCGVFGSSISDSGECLSGAVFLFFVPKWMTPVQKYGGLPDDSRSIFVGNLGTADGPETTTVPRRTSRNLSLELKVAEVA